MKRFIMKTLISFFAFTSKIFIFLGTVSSYFFTSLLELNIKIIEKLGGFTNDKN